jgi:hypothetical protein
VFLGPKICPRSGALAAIHTIPDALNIHAAGPPTTRIFVVSWLLPGLIGFYNIYAYCRWADDLGDEMDDPADMRLLACGAKV